MLPRPILACINFHSPFHAPDGVALAHTDVVADRFTFTAGDLATADFWQGAAADAGFAFGAGCVFEMNEPPATGVESL
jgi:hypothetical protein